MSNAPSSGKNFQMGSQTAQKGSVQANSPVEVPLATKARKAPSRKKGKKPVSKADSRAYKRLKRLPFWNEAERRIRAGVTPKRIAQWIQEEMLECQDIKHSSLVRQLQRYKASLSPDEIVTKKPLYVEEAIEGYQKDVDELNELEKLYWLQLKRISIDAATEEKINKLFASTNREIQLAVEILEKMLDKKMELGILKKEPERFEASFLSADVDLKGLDERQRARVGMIAGRVLTLLEQRLVEAESRRIVEGSVVGSVPVEGHEEGQEATEKPESGPSEFDDAGRLIDVMVGEGDAD